jgi:hypothetical protein
MSEITTRMLFIASALSFIPFSSFSSVVSQIANTTIAGDISSNLTDSRDRQNTTLMNETAYDWTDELGSCTAGMCEDFSDDYEKEFSGEYTVEQP